MNDFIITLLFGWLGVHKFMQKKYGLGILYFFTLGLCGIGWAVDTIAAFMRMTTGKQPAPATQNPNTFSGGGGGGYEPPANSLLKFSKRGSLELLQNAIFNRKAKERI